MVKSSSSPRNTCVSSSYKHSAEHDEVLMSQHWLQTRISVDGGFEAQKIALGRVTASLSTFGDSAVMERP